MRPSQVCHLLLNGELPNVAASRFHRTGDQPHDGQRKQFFLRGFGAMRIRWR
jgi:hypothetical protein